jgi:NodT family efflux transporter outer membrane factor (OMF) lipoprotein
MNAYSHCPISRTVARGPDRAHGPAKARRFARALVALWAPLVAGGCMLAADRPDPMLDVPSRYLAAAATARDRPPSLDWWREFRSGELTALMEEAQRVNFDIAAARARILQADAQARIAGAPLLPALSGEASATRARPSGATASGGGGLARDYSTHTVMLSASYEIDFWGKNRAAALAAEETAVATRYDRDVIALATLASVASAYFQLLSAQDRILIANRNIAAAERVLTAIRQRISAGTATDLEAAQQESVLASQKAAVPQLRQVYAQNMFALATLVSRPPESVRLHGGGLGQIATPRVTPGLPSELLLQRPDIRRAEAQLASATANIANARAQFFPSIQLTGQGGFQSAALSALFTPQAAFYSAAVSAAQPIFDGFRIMNNFELQQARQEELLHAYRKNVVSAFADVDNALVALRQTGERVRLQRQVVAASRRAFNLAELRLREGTVDIITVINAQTTLFQAEDAFAQAQLARMQAVVALFQALGGGWSRDEIARLDDEILNRALQRRAEERASGPAGSATTQAETAATLPIRN